MSAKIIAACAMGICLLASDLCAGAVEIKAFAKREPRIRQRAVVPARRPTVAPTPAPSVAIVGDELPFDYYRRRHGRRRRDYDVILSPLRGGYWGYRPPYLYWPAADTTRVVIGFGSKDRRVGGSYYVYNPGLYIYAPTYFPFGEDPRKYVRLDTPTVGAEREAEERAETAAPSEPGAPAGFGSALAPMLGGSAKVDLAFALGEAKLKEGSYQEAAAAFIRSGAERPADPVRRLALSLALAGAGHYESSAAALRQALSHASGWSALRVDTAKVFGSAEAFQRVVGLLREASAKKGASGDLKVLLAFLHFITGEYELSAQDLRGVYSADAIDPLAAELLLASESLLLAATGADETTGDGDE